MPFGRVWCIYTRAFDREKEDKVLNILRLVVDMDENDDDARVLIGVKAVLLEVQREAAEWGLHHVDVWNIAPVIEQAALELEPSSTVEPREDSIACLMRYGHLKSATTVEWVANEKFGNWF